MSNKLVCDTCEQWIEDGQTFFTVTAQKQSSLEGPLTADEGPKTFHYHDGHAPWQQLEEGVLALTSLNPTSGEADTVDAQIHCLGSGFVAGSVVVFDGEEQSSTFYSEGQVAALMTLPEAGNYSVKVRNPGNFETGALTFTVN